ASAATAPARRTAAARAWCGGRRADCTRQRAADAIDEAGGVAPRAARTRIPAKTLLTCGLSARKHIGEAVGPAVLDSERNRIRQIFLEEFRRLVGSLATAVVALALRKRQLLFEACNIVEHLAPVWCVSRFPPACRVHQR